MQVTQAQLIYEYEYNSPIENPEEFLADEGFKKFNRDNITEVVMMMNEVLQAQGRVADEYSINRLETTLKHEMPGFAITRKQVLFWLKENALF